MSGGEISERRDGASGAPAADQGAREKTRRVIGIGFRPLRKRQGPLQAPDRIQGGFLIAQEYPCAQIVGFE